MSSVTQEAHKKQGGPRKTTLLSNMVHPNRPYPIQSVTFGYQLDPYKDKLGYTYFVNGVSVDICSTPTENIYTPANLGWG